MKQTYFRQWSVGPCLGISPISCVVVWSYHLFSATEMLLPTSVTIFSPQAQPEGLRLIRCSFLLFLCGLLLAPLTSGHTLPDPLSNWAQWTFV